MSNNRSTNSVKSRIFVELVLKRIEMNRQQYYMQKGAVKKV